MKFGIVSDTHSNYHALKSVLDHMNSIGVDKKVHCGDIVGFGPKPKETLALTLENFNYIVQGEHDLAVVDEEESWGLSPQAKFAVDWTREKLSAEEVSYLKHLSVRQSVGDVFFSHESPLDGYQISFVGHTHKPLLTNNGTVIKPQDSYTKLKDGTSFAQYSFFKDFKAVVNVGSVGQPLDGDNRASYVIFDDETTELTFYKVPYAVDRTVGLMQRAGFSSNACDKLLFAR